MGYGSKKKKKKPSAAVRKTKGRLLSKDHASSADSNNDDVLSEELTVLVATYQDDFIFVSDSPPQYSINLRPYSKDSGFEDLDVSALLSLRFLPGYPHKCPKLKLTPGKSLPKNDADRLLSLLHEQANFDAREGRAMVFNLVEAAKEFLSEIVPVDQPNKPVSCPSVERGDQWIHGEVSVTSNKDHLSRGPHVYGLVDLFTGSGESWDWVPGADKSRGTNSLFQDHKVDRPNIGYTILDKHVFHNEKAVLLKDVERGLTPQSIGKLGSLEEESESDSSSASSRSLTEESIGSGATHMDQQEPIDVISKLDGGILEDNPSDLVSSILIHDRASEAVKKDLMMVHLLHLACTVKGPLAEGLAEITSELYNIGIFSESARDWATKSPSLLNQAFNHVFREQVVLSPNSQFWNGTSNFATHTTSLPSSRYLNDFEELCSLGHGGFGHVALCKNKLDGRQYAMKKIRLKDKSLQVNDRILREVATLSRLQHQHVVRYYQAWFETEVGDGYNDSTSGSRTASCSSYSYMGPSSTDVIGPENVLESTYLYIQMEYCPRTLRQVFESYGSLFVKELAWHLFRQIIEGLAHIHAQGIIHRDLTPNNIFFDARNDIKIGDFGLAKFLKLEQLDHEPLYPTDTVGVSVDGTTTGQVGTYFYTAPEIEQGWPKINEKVDMYSVGVVFFELWHPFETAMERHIVLSDLKQKGLLPPSWVAEYPEQASILRLLMSPSPSDRPSATELLQTALPPRMEDEWLN
ncbi:eIF-2-alpha kinase GCN2, partial [Thalictrum thalictroides]